MSSSSSTWPQIFRYQNVISSLSVYRGQCLYLFPFPLCGAGITRWWAARQRLLTGAQLRTKSRPMKKISFTARLYTSNRRTTLSSHPIRLDCRSTILVHGTANGSFFSPLPPAVANLAAMQTDTLSPTTSSQHWHMLRPVRCR